MIASVHDLADVLREAIAAETAGEAQAGDPLTVRFVGEAEVSFSVETVEGRRYLVRVAEAVG